MPSTHIGVRTISPHCCKRRITAAAPARMRTDRLRCTCGIYPNAPHPHGPTPLRPRRSIRLTRQLLPASQLQTPRRRCRPRCRDRHPAEIRSSRSSTTIALELQFSTVSLGNSGAEDAERRLTRTGIQGHPETTGRHFGQHSQVRAVESRRSSGPALSGLTRHIWFDRENSLSAIRTALEHHREPTIFATQLLARPGYFRSPTCWRRCSPRRRGARLTASRRTPSAPWA